MAGDALGALVTSALVCTVTPVATDSLGAPVVSCPPATVIRCNPAGSSALAVVHTIVRHATVIVHAPAKGRLFVGGLGLGAFEMTGELSNVRAITVRPTPSGGMVAVGSRSHNDAKTEEFLQQFAVTDFISAGSSLKFCLVAAGEADLYARAGRTMEWDTAAGQAVLLAAGGSMTLWSGEPFIYGKPGFENPGFVARGF